LANCAFDQMRSAFDQMCAFNQLAYMGGILSIRFRVGLGIGLRFGVRIRVSVRVRVMIRRRKKTGAGLLCLL